MASRRASIIAKTSRITPTWHLAENSSLTETVLLVICFTEKFNYSPEALIHQMRLTFTHAMASHVDRPTVATRVAPSKQLGYSHKLSARSPTGIETSVNSLGLCSKCKPFKKHIVSPMAYVSRASQIVTVVISVDQVYQVGVYL